MCRDRRRVRENVINLRVSDYEHAELTAQAERAGRQLAAYVHDLVMAQLAFEEKCNRHEAGLEDDKKRLKTDREGVTPCPTSRLIPIPMISPRSSATRSFGESRSTRP